MAVEYPPREVLACRMAMIEVFTILGEYRDRIALVGGWIPPLLAPESAKLHTGSLLRSSVGLETIPAVTPRYLADLNKETAALADKIQQNLEELGA